MEFRNLNMIFSSNKSLGGGGLGRKKERGSRGPSSGNLQTSTTCLQLGLDSGQWPGLGGTCTQPAPSLEAPAPLEVKGKVKFAS